MIIYARTQDKSKILKIEGMDYEQKRTVKKTVYGGNVTEEIVETKHNLVWARRFLGEYATKERCLEVMTQFQTAIDNKSTDSTLVFNMPER
jgi:hypothetical protein